MKFSRTIDFKIGAKDSDLIPLLELPKTNGGILPLDVYVCEACGQVQFFAPLEIKESLLRLAK